MPPVVESILSTNIEGIFHAWERDKDRSYFKLWENSGPQIIHHFGVCLRDGARCAYLYDSRTNPPISLKNFPDSLEFVPQNNHHHLIRCCDPRFHNEFNQIIKEWALRADDAVHPVDAFAKVISDWNRFLNQDSEMSRSKVIGLFGELDFLEKALGPAADIRAAAIEQWLGSGEGTIDFRNGNKAVEVKASTVRSSNKGPGSSFTDSRKLTRRVTRIPRSGSWQNESARKSAGFQDPLRCSIKSSLRSVCNPRLYLRSRTRDFASSLEWPAPSTITFPV